MKRLILIVLLASGIYSCSSYGKEEFFFTNYFIGGYIDGPWKFTGVTTESPIRLYAVMPPGLPECEIYGPSDGEKFLRIAERNGDGTYNRKVMIGESPTCIADNYQAIHVFCQNRDWDEKHPKGAMLDDLAEIEFYSYANYVRSGYTDFGDSPVRKRLSELAEDDFAMVYYDFTIAFDSHPDSGSYEMLITLLTTEYKVKLGKFTFNFE